MSSPKTQRKLEKLFSKVNSAKWTRKIEKIEQKLIESKTKKHRPKICFFRKKFPDKTDFKKGNKNIMKKKKGTWLHVE